MQFKALKDSKTNPAPLNTQVSITPVDADVVRRLSESNVKTNQELISLLEAERSSYDYKVGPSDILSVIVYDHPELTIPAGAQRSAAESGNLVSPDGTILHPYTGRIRVDGQTVDESGSPNAVHFFTRFQLRCRRSISPRRLAG